MSAQTIAAGGVTSGRQTLIANEVHVVTFTDNIGAVAIWTDGTADVWYSTDGTIPAVDAARRIPAGVVGRLVASTTNNAAGKDVVQLLSVSTPVITVERT